LDCQPIRVGKPAHVKLHGKKREHGQKSFNFGLWSLDLVGLDTEWPFIACNHGMQVVIHAGLVIETPYCTQQIGADEFLPLASRLRVRLAIERASPQDIQDCLRHALLQAGAPTLMTAEVIATLCDHAQGNPRALMIMAGELLEVAAQREARQIDETLFFETCGVPAATETKVVIRRRR
jgi:hypothetical protein